MESSEVLAQEWDAVVIGTGVGGATLGYALARAGKRVLFCEKGNSHLGDAQALRSAYPESAFPHRTVPRPEHRGILSRAGRCWEEIEDRSNARSRKFIPFIGSGTGGSSALYGMAMERFFPCDFSPKANYPDATDASLPERWPVSYAELDCFYASAERLYRVRGTADPLRDDTASRQLSPSPALSPAGREVFEFLQRKGLNPYRLPQACEFVAGCEGCQGYLCARNCKNDSSRICLEPAMAEHGAALLDACNVVRLEADRRAITKVMCVRHGETLALRGKLVILAAGALATPRILLESTSAEWPNGLANESGLVGRNLMRHFVDLYAVFVKSDARTTGNAKELAFNDYYLGSGKKAGSVQSFGSLPPAPVLVASMVQDVRDGPMPWLAAALDLAGPALVPLLGRLFARASILASVMEDLPYPDNRVAVSSGPRDSNASQLAFSYRLRDHDRRRIEAFRSEIRSMLKPYRHMLIKQAENNQRIAHACGTCRFGDDPATSVLDRNNRAHGLDNLYVVDSSFFPSSGGTNPALTIAANALRVAEHLAGTSMWSEPAPSS